MNFTVAHQKFKKPRNCAYKVCKANKQLSFLGKFGIMIRSRLGNIAQISFTAYKL
jgi:hypothetical protein